MARQEPVSLDEIRRDPGRYLAFVHDPEATLADLITELQQVTGMSARQLAPQLGYSPSALSRIASGASHYHSPEACQQLAKKTALSFNRLVYASAISALPEPERREIARQGLTSHTPDNGYYDPIQLPHAELAHCATVAALKAAIDTHAPIREHRRALPPTGPQHIIVRQERDHMVNRREHGERAHSPTGPEIPRGALVEIELAAADTRFADGEIVLVQIGEEPATLHRFEALRDRAGHALYELYHVNDHIGGVARVVTHDPAGNAPATHQRRILGRATRIVDLELTGTSP